MFIPFLAGAAAGVGRGGVTGLRRVPSCPREGPFLSGESPFLSAEGPFLSGESPFLSAEGPFLSVGGVLAV